MSKSTKQSAKQQPRTLEGPTTLEEFLSEEGVLEEVTARAVKRVIALELRKAMAENSLSKIGMARRMRTSRRQLDRILDPEAHDNITIDTLTRAAEAVGRKLRVELV